MIRLRSRPSARSRSPSALSRFPHACIRFPDCQCAAESGPVCRSRPNRAPFAVPGRIRKRGLPESHSGRIGNASGGGRAGAAGTQNWGFPGLPVGLSVPARHLAAGPPGMIKKKETCTPVLADPVDLQGRLGCGALGLLALGRKQEAASCISAGRSTVGAVPRRCCLGHT